MKKPFLFIFIILLFVTPLYADEFHISDKVINVLDGDSIALEGGKEVRILGIDTPEFGEPFADDAKKRVEVLVLGKKVNIEVCQSNPTDTYGRTLGVVKVGKKDVGATLISEGLAFRYILHPCGTPLADKYLKLSNKAEKQGKGVWSSKELAPVKADLAAEAIGKRRAVEGVIVGSYKSRKGNVFLNFGPNYKTDFTLFIHNSCMKNFAKNGVDPVVYYKGKKVRVRGRVIEYNGPEIKVCHPAQIQIY